MTEEHNIYHLPMYNPLAAAASVTHVHPQIITMHTSAAPAPSMTISISEYNSLLDQFMARGDEITRLQERLEQSVSIQVYNEAFEAGVEVVEENERLRAVIRNVAHYLDAKRDVQGSLSAVEDALQLECERAMEGKE